MQRLAPPGDRAFPDHRSAPPPRQGRGWRVLGWVSIVMSAVLVVASIGFYMVYRSLDGQIHREHVDDKLGDHRPPKLNNSMNILMMGSDSRQGENAQYGTEQGERSDTTILLHISPGGGQAVGISFPRDSMVQRPSCKRRDGSTDPGGLSMINAAYATGGSPCTWKTLESLTNIRIDHFLEVDFAGFKRVVDALDGVEICVPHAVNDPKAELHLKKGRQTVQGDQALGYVRTRTGGLGDGSDLSRIQRQQAFMASVVKKATAKGMLTDPGKVYSFLSAATKSLKADDRMNMSVMQKLASSMRGMSAGKVRFVTVPVQAYPQDKNRVQFNQALAKPLFDAVREDNTLPNPAPAPVPAQGKGNKVPAKPVAPAKVKLMVYNATRTDGLGQRTADQLEGKGFKIAKVGTRKASSGFVTQILYGAGAEGQAAAVAAAVPGHPMKPWAGAKPGYVYLMIGKDGATVPGQARPVPKIAGEVRADRDVCAPSAT